MPSTRKIALLGGDGIGVEVVREARLLLEVYREEASFPLDLWDLDLGAERYLRDGTTMPDDDGSTTTPPVVEPYVQIVMTCTSPMPVGLRAVAPGDLVHTDPSTASRLIAAGYATPTDDDQEVT